MPSHAAEPVTVVEVAARDGLQSDPAQVSTDAKLELIDRALRAGLRRIEATSFVNPARVPQMADADDVMAALARRRAEDGPDGRYRAASFIGLVLNRRGAERALDAGCDELNAVVPVSDTFSRRNQGTDTDGAIEVWAQVVELAGAAGVPATVTLTTSFGCPYEGEIALDRLAEVARRCAQQGGAEIALADTIGVAVPPEVDERVAVLREALRDAGTDQQLRAHFHNTRNTAIACVAAAVDAGVRTVDASLGGIGGCPFAPNATGNVATEDVVYLLDRMGYDTGVDLPALVATAEWMQTGELLGHAVPGLVSKAGPWPSAPVG
jgi:hydroxymethylglutaryl-CoA lyase